MRNIKLKIKVQERESMGTIRKNNPQMKQEQSEELTLRKIVGSIMTNNVGLSTEEYEAMLKKIGVNLPGEDKATDKERLERIKGNFYGTTINMLFTILRQYNALAEEVEVWRALLGACCEKLGVDVSKVKTSTDKMNEAVENYVKTKIKKVDNK